METIHAEIKTLQKFPPPPCIHLVQPAVKKFFGGLNISLGAGRFGYSVKRRTRSGHSFLFLVEKYFGKGEKCDHTAGEE